MDTDQEQFDEALQELLEKYKEDNHGKTSEN